MSVTFSYYTYDPNCVEYTYWNGQECEPNYDEYCAQYDEYYQNLYNPNQNPNITVTVSFNGTNCVMNYESVETQLQYEYTNPNFTEIIIEEIIYQEVSTATPIYIHETIKKLTDGTRKKQYGLTAMTGIVTLGIFVFVI